MEEILRKLVAYPTVSGDTAAMHDLLDYVSGYLVALGMHIEWFESNGFESIVATTRPGFKTPIVMLGAHADVVSAESAMFEMRIANSTYIGRGVYDMKFAIAAYMLIVDELQHDLNSYNFGIMITPDEELGGVNGVYKLINEGYLPAVCILPDGGDNWQVQTSSRGIQHYDISYAGKAAHGARPWLGDNALEKLLAVYTEIRQAFPEHPHPDTSTISLTRMSGGEASNQIPDLATMSIDVRAAGSTEYQRLAEHIRMVCERRKASCLLTSEGAPTSYDLADPMIAPFASLIESVAGVKAQGFCTPAASDARYYVPYGVPVISVYPTGGDHHGPNEWISIAACDKFKEITLRYLQSVATTRRKPGRKRSASSATLTESTS